MSERVRTLRKQVANTTNVAQALAQIRRALDDLYNQSNRAKARALEIIDERSLKLAGLMADLEVTESICNSLQRSLQG